MVLEASKFMVIIYRYTRGILGYLQLLIKGAAFCFEAPEDGKAVATPSARAVATPMRTEQAPPVIEPTEATQPATKDVNETQPEPKLTQQAGTEPKPTSAEQLATSPEPSGSQPETHKVDSTQPDEQTGAPAKPKPAGITERQAGLNSFAAWVASC